jgi:hypothetical protein
MIPVTFVALPGWIIIWGVTYDFVHGFWASGLGIYQAKVVPAFNKIVEMEYKRHKRDLIAFTLFLYM